MSITKNTSSGRPVLNPARIRMPQESGCSTRTPISGYLDEYIAAEIECMVRDVGGWRRCSPLQNQNRLLIDWIEKSAGSFRSRLHREPQLVGA